MKTQVVLMGAPHQDAPRKARTGWRLTLGILGVLAGVAMHEALELILIGVGVLMAGQEAEAAGAAVAPASENTWAWQYEALHTGKAEAIHVTFNALGSSTTVNMALMSDEAGKPGTVLAEGSFSGTAAGSHEAAITATEVTSGTKYWLVLQPQGGGVVKLKEGSTTPTRKATVKHAKISEVTAANWVAEEKRGPVSIWATGTESSAGVTIPLNAASSTSTGSLAVTAPTRVATGASASTSTASLAVTAPTSAPLSAASSSSTSSAAVTAPTQVPLAGGSSSSAGSMSLTVATQIPLGSGASQSTGLLAVTAATRVPLAAAASTSSASAAVSVVLRVPLAAALSTSAAGLGLTAVAGLPLNASSSTSGASAIVTAPPRLTLIAEGQSSAVSTLTAPPRLTLATAVATSTASAGVTVIVTDLEPCEVTIRNLPQVVVEFRHYPAVDVKVINARRS